MSSDEHRANRKVVLRDWSILVSWALLIFATVPFVRILQGWIANRVGSVFFGYSVLIAIIATAVGSIVLVRRSHHRPSARSLLFLAIIAAVFVWWTLHLWGQPEEAVHFLEYGVLGVLAFRAMRHRLDDAAVFIAAALLGTFIGTLDEIIQWITPERFWDLRDIIINGGASALIQIGLWQALPTRTQALGRHSLRLVCRLATAELVLLALCMANTPTRVEVYSTRIPWLGFLAANPNAMSEFGHLYRDPAIGVFKSRFPAAELAEIDRRRGAEVGAILDRFPHNRYGAFLRTYTPGTDPFAHEARVHLFNRNHNLTRARGETPGSEAHRERCAVALCEDLILESYFPNTISASTSRFDEARRGELRTHAVADFDFRSKAGAHLVTAVSERQLQGILWAGIVALVVLEARIMSRRRRESSMTRR